MIYSYILSMGSNLGDRTVNLQTGCRELEKHGQINKISSVWSTAPVGMEPSPDFLNIAVEYSTDLAPEQLLDTIKNIEKNTGRDITQFKKSRPLDIDIIIWSNGKFISERLQIPHKEAKLRKFVVNPVNEIAQGTFDPVFDDEQLVKRYPGVVFAVHPAQIKQEFK